MPRPAVAPVTRMTFSSREGMFLGLKSCSLDQNIMLIRVGKQGTDWKNESDGRLGLKVVANKAQAKIHHTAEDAVPIYTRSSHVIDPY